MVLDTNTVFDVQVKRFHAYKRQLLNVFKVLDIYNRILSDSSYNPRPTSFIFSARLPRATPLPRRSSASSTRWPTSSTTTSA